MSDFPRLYSPTGHASGSISVPSLWSLGPALHLVSAVASAGQVLPTDGALFVPFRVPRIVTAYQIIVGCGSGAGNNFDVGIYDRFGNRLVSSGSVARTASTEMVQNITDTVLLPGLYYMAIASDSASTMVGWIPAQLGLSKMLGVKQMDTAFPLPDPATFITPTNSIIPSINIVLRPE